MKFFELKLGMEVKCYGYLQKVKKKYVFPDLEPELYTEEQLEVLRCTKNADSILLKPFTTIKQKQYEAIAPKKSFDGIVVGIKQIALYKEYVCDRYSKKDIYYIDSYVSGKEDNVVLCAVVHCDFTWDGTHKERLVPLDRLAKINKYERNEED